jgi:hypothetical protein
VISWASVIFGVIPAVGRCRLSCGDAFISSSILTYSASMHAETWATEALGCHVLSWSAWKSKCRVGYR